MSERTQEQKQYDCPTCQRADAAIAISSACSLSVTDAAILLRDLGGWADLEREISTLRAKLEAKDKYLKRTIEIARVGLEKWAEETSVYEHGLAAAKMQSELDAMENGGGE